MSFLLPNVPLFSGLNDLLKPCNTVCVRNINGVNVFVTTPENELDVYYGPSVTQIYEFTNLQYLIPLPWNLPSRYN